MGRGGRDEPGLTRSLGRRLLTEAVLVTEALFLGDGRLLVADLRVRLGRLTGTPRPDPPLSGPAPGPIGAAWEDTEGTEDLEGEAEEAEDADAGPAGDVGAGTCEGLPGYDGTRSFFAPAPGPGESVEPGRPCARPGPCVASGLRVEPCSYAAPLSYATSEPYADAPSYADTAAASAEAPPYGSTASSSPVPTPTPHSPRRLGVTSVTPSRCSVATE